MSARARATRRDDFDSCPALCCIVVMRRAAFLAQPKRLSSQDWQSKLRSLARSQSAHANDSARCTMRTRPPAKCHCHGQLSNVDGVDGDDEKLYEFLELYLIASAPRVLSNAFSGRRQLARARARVEDAIMIISARAQNMIERCFYHRHLDSVYSNCTTSVARYSDANHAHTQRVPTASSRT